jgi:hypothetical protein
MDDIQVTADDMPPLPPCTCTDMGDGVFITNLCPQHCPITGVLRDGVQFTGLLSVLDATRQERSAH